MALRRHAPDSLHIIIGRIEAAIDQETAAIRNDHNFDLKASNARKSRHLYELNRALKGANENAVRIEHREALQRLRDKLAINEAVIRAHMSAVSEVASLLQNAIRHSETDGTYSAHEVGRSGSA
ncbi:MAG TPA: hypothetical protein VFT89_10975 [Rhizobiaceae bacterium]|nr:hypothetical protein [Rhizobiaceae bacterium]